MSTLETELYYRVDITLKALADASTLTVRLCNRPILDDSSGNVYYPILSDISGLRNRVTQTIPRAETGKIEISNAPGSFEFNRRFSDLLERYTVIDQPIAVYIAEVTADDTDVHSNFSLLWTSIGKSQTTDPNRDTCVINIEAIGIDADVPVTIVNSDTFADAPSASLGKSLPLVFGTDRQVRPIRINADGDATPAYAYATTLGTDYPTGGVQKYYLKNDDGDYQQVISANSSFVQATQTDTTFGTLTSLTTNERAFQIENVSTGAYITQLGVTLKGAGSSGTVAGDLVFRIYKPSPLLGPEKQYIRETRIDLADYSAEVQASAEFTVYPAFERGYFCNGDDDYFLSITLDDNGSTVYPRIPYYIDLALAYWSRSRSTEDGFLFVNLYNVKITQYGLYLVDTDSSADNYASFEVSQKSVVGDQVTPDLTTLDWVVEIDGLEDDSSGTITGGAGTTLTEPQDIVQLLLTPYSSGWDASNSYLDTTKFSATHTQFGDSTAKFYRQIGGSTQGRVGRASVIADICLNSASRLVRYNGSSNQFALYGWGTTQSTAQINSEDVVFTDENSQIVRWWDGGRDTIVNDILAAYDRIITSADVVTGTAEGQFKEFAGILKWNTDTALVAELVQKSVDVWGTRSLDGDTFPFIADATSMQAVAYYILADQGYGYRYAILRVPLRDFYSLGLLDVVEIKHSSLPAYYGTTPNAADPHYQGTSIDVAKGKRLIQAQRYRAQILGFDLDTNIRSNQPGTIDLEVRLLLNHPKDPT